MLTKENTKGTYVGPNILFRPIPSHIDNLFYATSGNIAYTVPAGAAYIVFSAGVDFYVDPKATIAAVPTATVLTGAAAEKNPVGYEVSGGEILNIIASAADSITVTVYSK